MSARELLSEWEARFDGPIPQRPIDAARGYDRELSEAECAVAFFRRHAFGQVEIIRERRANGTEYPALAEDLKLYRRQWHAARRHLAEVKRVRKGCEDAAESRQPDPDYLMELRRER